MIPKWKATRSTNDLLSDKARLGGLVVNVRSDYIDAGKAAVCTNQGMSRIENKGRFSRA